MTPERLKLLTALCPTLFTEGQLQRQLASGTRQINWRDADGNLHLEHVVIQAIREGFVTIKITEKGVLALQDEIRSRARDAN